QPVPGRSLRPAHDFHRRTTAARAAVVFSTGKNPEAEFGERREHVDVLAFMASLSDVFRWCARVSHARGPRIPGNAAAHLQPPFGMNIGPCAAAADVASVGGDLPHDRAPAMLVAVLSRGGIP